jgi:ADP-ribose pyrophosphatase YjhB (NUDIX family)
MGRRIDYLDDPNAPDPNSLVPSANSIVTNERGEILLIQRTDNGNWSLPGGAMDIGESLGQTATRETLEETGIRTRLTGISGIYTNPNHVLEYTSDGEVRQEFSVVFTAETTGGEPTPSSESSHVEWVAPTAVGDLQMHPSMRKRIDRFLADDDTPYWD